MGTGLKGWVFTSVLFLSRFPYKGEKLSLPQVDWKRNAYILTTVQLVMRIAITSLRPFIPLYIRELGVSVPEQVAFWAGVVASVNFVAQAFTQPIWGNLSDRYGRKPMVIRTIVAVGVFNLMIARVTNVYQLVGLRFLMGTVSGFNAASVALVAAVTPSDKLGYAVGLVQAGQMAGTILGPALGGTLAEMFGYRGTFLVAGGLILTMVPVVALGVREEFAHQTQENNKGIYEKILNGNCELVEGGVARSSIKRWLPLGTGERLIVITLLVIACSQFGTQSMDTLMALFI